MSKYDPLRVYLAARYPHEVALTFDEIHGLVGGLPPSANKWPAFWANEESPRTHYHKKAWNAAGYKPKHYDLGTRLIVFEARQR